MHQTTNAPMRKSVDASMHRLVDDLTCSVSYLVAQGVSVSDHVARNNELFAPAVGDGVMVGAWLVELRYG